MLLGPMFTKGAAGAVPTGKFEGRMILVEAMWDREAFPWQADWYRSLVKKHLGEKADENFRVWFVDRALHGDGEKQEFPDQTVPYLGVLQQALRDVAAWVETGRPPPESSGYRMEDARVILADDASERKGVQPLVRLAANRAQRAEVSVSGPVALSATIEALPGGGKIVSASWDFEGSGKFAAEALTKAGKERITLRTVHRYNRPGTYFPTLRVVLQRDGREASLYANIVNLGQARVVVSDIN